MLYTLYLNPIPRPGRWSGSGHRLACGGDDGRVRIFDIDEGSAALGHKGHSRPGQNQGQLPSMTLEPLDPQAGGITAIAAAGPALVAFTTSLVR